MGTFKKVALIGLVSVSVSTAAFADKGVVKLPEIPLLNDRVAAAQFAKIEQLGKDVLERFQVSDADSEATVEALNEKFSVRIDEEIPGDRLMP